MSLDVTDFPSLNDYMVTLGRQARSASRELATSPSDRRSNALRQMARSLRDNAKEIVAANETDLSAANAKGLSEAMIDRLTLDADRVSTMAQSIESIAEQSDPLNMVLDQWTQPNGLSFTKVSVPLGVIGMIYESRPNVTADAAALCIRSGNAVILRGGSEAVHSNRMIHGVIQQALNATGLPKAAVQLVGTQNRDAVGALLGGLEGHVDLIIPRGGKGLVARVQQDARVPVLAHLDGLNHTYVHADANFDMARAIVANAKMRRTGICGATETVLIDKAIAEAFIPSLVDDLSLPGCEVRGDTASISMDVRVTPATDEDFRTEHLAPILNMAIVDGLEAALGHIAEYGSGHTDAIVTDNEEAATRFLKAVDSAIVLHNASTQFADGGEFGFGAEIGIATGRMHARGPVGAQHLTSYKYQVVGSGTLRP